MGKEQNVDEISLYYRMMPGGGGFGGVLVNTAASEDIWVGLNISTSGDILSVMPIV